MQPTERTTAHKVPPRRVTDPPSQLPPPCVGSFVTLGSVCFVSRNDGLADIEATWDVECKLRDPCRPL